MVYVFLADGFEEIEAVVPIDLLKRAGVEVTTVGIGGDTIRGRSGIEVYTDVVEYVGLGNEVEMIVLPGGQPGTKNLEESDVVQETIDYCVDKGIYIAAICAAPTILGHKDLLKDHAAVCYSGLENELNCLTSPRKDVVVSGQFITSKSAGTAFSFGLKLVELLKGSEVRRKLEKNLIIDNHYD
jgi:4-methyl-5(b-hydroxyethyl)-thiazole monophosphate biosynthesis